MAPSSKSVLWSIALLLCVFGSISGEAQPPLLKLVPFSAVDIRSGFWMPRQRVNREKTIPHVSAHVGETLAPRADHPRSTGRPGCGASRSG